MDLYDILTKKYNKRFNRIKKKDFRKYVKTRYQNQGYDVYEDKSLMANNLYIGNIKSNKVLMAHYDTPPNMGLFLIFNNALGAKFGQIVIILILVISLFLVGTFIPQYYGIYNIVLFLYIISMFLIGNKNNYNDNTSGVLTLLTFLEKHAANDEYLIVLTDNEEKGLFGAYKFRRFMKNKGLLNEKNIVVVDCVGTGEEYAIISFGNNPNADKFCSINDEEFYIQRYKSKILVSDNGVLGKNAFLVSKLSKSKYFAKPTIKDMHTSKDKNLNIKNIEDVHKMIENYFKD